MKLKALLKSKEARKAELVAKSEKTEDITELRSINAELEALNTEIEVLRSATTESEEQRGSAGEEGAQSQRTAAVNGEHATPPDIVATSAMGESRASADAEIEKTIDALAEELRSGKEVTITPEIGAYLEKRDVTSTGTLIEHKYSRDIKDRFNQVAQTIDLVDSFNLDGGTDYSVSVETEIGEGDYTGEGEVYTQDESTYVTLPAGRAKITNSATVSEEVVKLPNIDYVGRIYNNLRKSIRRKTSGQIISGDGKANKLKGFYSQDVAVIPADYQVEVAKIDSDTLAKIVFGYGGDEDMEGPATLFLNKKDLAAFGSVKAADGRPYYKITIEGSGGTIEDAMGGTKINYSINSECNALSDASTAGGTKTMVYGDPMCYELPMFTPLTMKSSEHRYMEKGQILFTGSVIVGGVVNKYKGIMPVVKAAAK